MKAFKELEVVALIHDVPEHGLRADDWGTIVMTFDPSHFEVEFVEEGGHTRALLTLSKDDIRHLRADEIERPRVLSSKSASN